MRLTDRSTGLTRRQLAGHAAFIVAVGLALLFCLSQTAIWPGGAAPPDGRLATPSQGTTLRL